MNKQREIIGSGCGTDAFLLRRDPFWLQSSLLHSKPKSTVGTPAYIAPEVLSRREYDGKVSQSLSLSPSADSPLSLSLSLSLPPSL